MSVRKANEKVVNSLFGEISFYHARHCVLAEPIVLVAYLRNTKVQHDAKNRLTLAMQQALQKSELDASKLIPDFAVGCRRLTPSTGYLEVS